MQEREKVYSAKATYYNIFWWEFNAINWQN